MQRFYWLSASAAVLVLATALWIARVASIDAEFPPGSSGTNWWTKAPVWGVDASLPEISGKLFGVAVQRFQAMGGPERVWIFGSGGLLGYSDSQDRCWNFYDYDNKQGLFRPRAKDPCTNASLAHLRESVGIGWPELLPSVLAASAQSSSTSAEQKPSPAQTNVPTANQNGPANVRQKNSDAAGTTGSKPQLQSPLQNQQIQQQAPDTAASGSKATGSANRQSPISQSDTGTAPTQGPITVFPTVLDFGDIVLPARNANSTSAHAPGMRLVSVRNEGKSDVRIAVSGLIGETAGEFRLDQTCDSAPLKAGESCAVKVAFFPKSAGKKSGAFDILNEVSPPVTVQIHANLHEEGVTGITYSAPTKPEQDLVTGPAAAPDKKTWPPPSQAPDLLSVTFVLVDKGLTGGKIVSTGGLEWVTDRDETGTEFWKLQRNHKGTTIYDDEHTWRLAGPATEDFATETRRLDKSTGQGKFQVPCTDCVVASTKIAWGQSNETGWVAGWSTDDSGGPHAALFRTADGTTWQPMTRGALPRERRVAAASLRPWRWMPRWFLLILILSLALAAPALLPPEQQPPADESEARLGSVEGRLSSDKPLSPGEYDALGVTSIALGLSRFLRNEKTLPPLTIAINGEWGSGKSSLMNLLRCDLQSYGMHPVWFNAWHHQKEEHLLAALLQTLRLEAVPPFRNLLGVPFRVRLLLYWLRRRWPALVAIAAALFFFVMLDHRVRVDEHMDLFLWLVSQVLPSFSGKPSTPVSSIPVQGGLVALIAGVSILWKGLTAFGANPAALLASVAKGNKIKDLEEQTSFREKFAQEFQDFTKALGPRRPLTIFIDDLDRCLPANVRDVLEAVNFLVSSGDCFVVLGMDRRQVQRAVGLSFKEVAEEAGVQDGRANSKSPQPDPATSQLGEETARRRSELNVEPLPRPEEDAKEVARRQRADFAQKYLEKLINLEVRVPLAADDKTKRHLFQKEQKRESISWQQKALRAGLVGLQWAVPAALIVLLVIGGFQSSRTLALLLERSMKETRVPLNTEVPPQTTAPPLTGPAAASPEARSQPAMPTNSTAGGSPGTLSDEGELVAPSGIAWKYSAGREAWPARWILSVPFYFVGICLLLLANLALTIRPGVVTKDSKQFTDALECVWYPLVLAKQNTPRTAKRFVNRLRYLAMRQRAYEDKALTWEKVLFPQRLREPAGRGTGAAIPEPLLVAMAAIEQLEPGLIYNDAAFQWLVSASGTRPDFVGGDSPEARLLEKARLQHQKEFPTAGADWNLLGEHRETFIKIWPPSDPIEPV